MPSFDQQRASQLTKLAQRRLGRSLSTSEKDLIERSTSSHDFVAPLNHVLNSTLDASFVRWLASDINASTLFDPKGIRLVSTYLDGDLDLNKCRLSTSILFQECEFNGEIRLGSTVTKNVEFRNCVLKRALAGDDATIEGSVHICDSVVLDEIRLERIDVAGELSFAGLDVQSPSAAICLDGASVKGSVLFTNGFRTNSSVQMHNARMGDLDCSGAVFSNAKTVFSLDGIIVNGDLSLSQGSSCLGEIRLPGAHIQGNMECINAEIRSLVCHNMVVDADLMWADIKNKDESRLSLVGVRVKGFRDQKQSWPKQGNLDLKDLSMTS